jgi:hypothetical protein
MKKGISRRGFLKGGIAGICLSLFNPFHRVAKSQANPFTPLFWIKDIPVNPFYPEGTNHHTGLDALLDLMGENGLKFYRSPQESPLSGPSGMIYRDDVVLIKVNAQWKYRGCTNSDLIRGLIQAILDHPDGFSGEVVIFENGQGRGSLHCNNTGSGYPDGMVHANANDESQSFLYLVNTIFDDPRVSSYLLDPIGGTFINANNHVNDGYRTYEDVSYPCFTTAGGHRVELLEGLWQGSGYTQNLKLINVPVLKIHAGSEITASLKHFYGIVSMNDGQSPFRHYSGLGETCGKMVASVRTPVLNIIDAIWVSFSSLSGYPAAATFRASQILASQDPVALDYWAAKHILYPITQDSRHLPAPGGTIDRWLTAARGIINGRGGLYDPDGGILVEAATKDEQQMATHEFIFDDTASTPNAPQGPGSGLTGTSYRYTTGGSISGTGNPVQYLFDWGDGTDSGWLPVGQLSVSKSWALPGPYQVKVQARSAFQINALSPWSETLWVTIDRISVFVVSPNGAETWSGGSTQTIRWRCIGNPGPYIRIELLKGGVVNRAITQLALTGRGYCNWKVPSTQASGSDYQIRITSRNNGSYTDTSDNNFNIVEPLPPSITVVSPNGGDAWTAGSNQRVEWSYSGNLRGFVKIELLKGGALHRTITSLAWIGAGGHGSYSWRIPSSQVPGSDYRIRVTSRTNGVCTDSSDSDFSIA